MNSYRLCSFIQFLIIALCTHYSNSCASSLDLLGQELIKAGSNDLAVGGYSVPIAHDWNNDGHKDLIIGEQPTSSTGKIRVYLNNGTDNEPNFGSFSYVQSSGSDLIVSCSGCLGAAPCIVYWNELGRKDLLVGTADGHIIFYKNIGTDETPIFDGGTRVLCGLGNKTEIDVGDRAIPAWADWNNDGKNDLIAGALDGKIRVFFNSGTSTAPDLANAIFVQCAGADLAVPYSRSSPSICDFDGDGKKDLITGNTNGQLFFYRNSGSDAEPSFAGYLSIHALGSPVAFSPSGLRSRPFVCDWDEDGLPDIISGYGDGKVHLFRGTFFGDLDYNKKIDMQDYAIFSEQWFCSGDLNADIYPAGGNGTVDFSDLNVFIQNWCTAP